MGSATSEGIAAQVLAEDDGWSGAAVLDVTQGREGEVGRRPRGRAAERR